jgi:hypothetical protein
MKYILALLILVLAGCTRREPTYHYGDAVEIISGFYRTCKGEVRDYKPWKYAVKLQYNCGYDEVWADESNLKAIK